MITLEQAKVGRSDYLDQNVIDSFRQSSQLLDSLIFDDSVTQGIGSKLTYKYMREVIPAAAQTRAINTEYTPQEATRTEHSVDLKIFGGSFQIDRVVAGLSELSGIVSEVSYQINKKVESTCCLFHKTVIQGDSDIDQNSFDGLDKALTGTVTEINADSVIDLSTASAIAANYEAVMAAMDEAMSELCGRPSFIMANTTTLNKLKQVARKAGYMTRSEDAFGRSVDGYDGIPFLDMRYYPHKEADGSYTEKPIIPIKKRNIGGEEISGLTDIYFPVIGRDSFHGVTVKGDNFIKQYLPNFNEAGAVKKGEVELLAAIALKSTRGAGVLRNIKIR